mmetsp:Transcript_25839/g.44092  ORF Transcript_25839/g.44092 Transcript_25839/m.44092 type:complete len:239 (+) Transcript_25839:486-1202(+)
MPGHMHRWLPVRDWGMQRYPRDLRRRRDQRDHERCRPRQQRHAAEDENAEDGNDHLSRVRIDRDGIHERRHLLLERHRLHDDQRRGNGLSGDRLLPGHRYNIRDGVVGVVLGRVFLACDRGGESAERRVGSGGAGCDRRLEPEQPERERGVQGRSARGGRGDGRHSRPVEAARGIVDGRGRGERDGQRAAVLERQPHDERLGQRAGGTLSEGPGRRGDRARGERALHRRQRRSGHDDR